ncbi:MAG: hypothetical protein HQL38_03225 [Alphaproteobacteria bacterium]|nr:hypothetical protein [Alphaproteobacteria bacterium]
MRTRVLVAPNARISLGVAQSDASSVIRAIERHAAAFLTTRRLVSTIRNQWHYLRLGSGPLAEVGVRIRTDMYPGIEIHEWATPNAVVHFLLTSTEDRRFSASALILQVFAP